MQFNTNDILFLLVLFLLLFIAVFLFTSYNGKRISNVLIGAFFLAIALNLTDSFLLLKQFYLRYPSYALWGSNLLLVCGPLLFFYVQSVLYKDFAFTKNKLLHFIPFVLLFFIGEISYLSASATQQIKILHSITERRIPSPVYLVSSLIYIHFILYLLAALRLLKRYRVAASNQYSNAQRATLAWLWQTIVFFFALIIISTANSFLSFLSLKQSYFLILSITIFLLLVFVMYVLFKALRNPGIFSVWEQKQVEEALNTKYASSALTAMEKDSLLKKLQDHMLRKKPYLEPELTLDELANQLLVKPKSLSQVINELLGQNFFEFINRYRIEEAKHLLTAPADKKITVLEVLYEVGFNSKSSFNTLFKKETGLTPSEFKKKNMVSREW